MPSPQARVAVPGSERRPLPDAQPSHPLAPDERLEVTVRVRPRAPLPAQASALADAPLAQRQYLTREQLEQQYGADPHDLAQVRDFAHAHHLTVVHTDAARRSVTLAGTVADVGAAFGTELRQYSCPTGTYRGRVGMLTVPAPLGDIVQGVFGLDDRPQAEPHFQVRPGGPGGPGPIVAHAVSGAFTPPQLARLYQFPQGADGTGQTIAIIELGGGFRPADLKAYFAGLGLPAPAVKVVSVNGGRNQPTNANSADGEVLLDIEVAAAVAPKARIVVYFAPNTSQGFLNAITQAVHDKVNKPGILSISWGGPESTWTAQALEQFNQAFQAAALLGVTVCCAAGDNGSADGVADGQPHADFPASSPFALACGGTKLVASGTGIGSETVWNEGPNSATGGGISAHFPVPDYQRGLKLPATTPPGRGLPDVAADADPATGYEVRVDGQSLVIGGTSAVAPLWAGLLALLNQRLPRPVGFLNPLLYGSLQGKGATRDITEGNNGAYQAGPGWDACTGWGSPVGAALLAALQGGAAPAA